MASYARTHRPNAPPRAKSSANYFPSSWHCPKTPGETSPELPFLAAYVSCTETRIDSSPTVEEKKKRERERRIIIFFDRFVFLFPFREKVERNSKRNKYILKEENKKKTTSRATVVLVKQGIYTHTHTRVCKYNFIFIVINGSHIYNLSFPAP